MCKYLVEKKVGLSKLILLQFFWKLFIFWVDKVNFLVYKSQA